MRIITKSS